MAFHPYLFFGGDCRAAFTRYGEVFGADPVLLTAADMPAEEQPPSGAADLIMHAALMTGRGLLMGSDDPTTDAFGPVQGMQVSYEATDPDDAGRVFDALAEGGTVTMPLGATSWSPAFGMLVDAFGTPWMISAPGDQPA